MFGFSAAHTGRAMATRMEKRWRMLFMGRTVTRDF
jgi:hypothetical protein